MIFGERRQRKAGGDRAAAYERHKTNAAKRQRDQSAAGREIGQLPAIADPERRAATAASLARFAKVYFPETFSLEFSDAHHRVIGKVEDAVHEGGTFATAMPRGSGKTQICIAAVLWAVLHAFRFFPLLLGGTIGKGHKLLRAVKTELATNPLLLADFPEACYPVRCLHGAAQRGKSQTLGGKLTHLDWGSAMVALASIDGAKCSGSVIAGDGLLGDIRGIFYKTPDGRTLRPDFVIADDPQTDRSARSQLQTSQRVETLNGTVLGLAGPGVQMACVMPCTVIQANDMADQALDNERNPQWRGERIPMMRSMPTNRERWDEYHEVRRAAFRRGGPAAAAEACAEFYVAHREDLDAGADPTWPARWAPAERSAVQHAMNFLFDRGPAAFAAEAQNDPRPPETQSRSLDAKALVKRLNGIPRQVVPTEAAHVVAHVDCQDNSLWYTVAAFTPNFSGAVVEYATWPRQPLRWYTQATLARTLQDEYPDRAFEAQLHEGLTALIEQLVNRTWAKEDGTELRLSRLLIDAQDGDHRETIYRLVRRSPHAAILLPSHGKGVKSDAQPMSRYRPKEGEQIGEEWKLDTHPQHKIRYLTLDTNYWKTFTAKRLQTAPATKGSLTLFGRDEGAHELIAAHYTAEYFTPTEGRDRLVDVWAHKPERFDNHWWDNLVACHAAASTLGARIRVSDDPEPQARRGKRRATPL